MQRKRDISDTRVEGWYCTSTSAQQTLDADSIDGMFMRKVYENGRESEIETKTRVDTGWGRTPVGHLMTLCRRNHTYTAQIPSSKGSSKRDTFCFIF